MTQHIRQLDRFGCAVACMAMVRGVPYAAVRADMSEVGRGHDFMSWQDYLARHGFAAQMAWHTDQISQQKRSPWPLEPWADLHLCCVDAGCGSASHLVVMLADGAVLDPASDVPRRLADYASVAYMAAIHPVAAPAAPRHAPSVEEIAQGHTLLDELDAGPSVPNPPWHPKDNCEECEDRNTRIFAEAADFVRAVLTTPDRGEAQSEEDGWKPAETAPPNQAVQVYIPHLDYYGNNGVYAGMLVDMGTGQHWMTFAWAMGRDMCGENRPTHWRPLPASPAEQDASQGGGR